MRKFILTLKTAAITGFSLAMLAAPVITQGQGQTPLFFKLGGNTTGNGNGFSDKLGFKTPDDLRFITDDTEWMTFNQGW